MMDFAYSVEETLLWAVVLIFLAGITGRIACLTYSILRVLFHQKSRLTAAFLVQARLFFPLYKVLMKKPAHTVLLYAFHVSILVVPLCFSGHILLWEEYRFSEYLTPLPDEWIDRMTLFVIGMAFYLGSRRFFSRKRRLLSSGSDYLRIGIAVIPFATGYCLTHGSLNAVPFFRDNLQTLHLLSAEAMMLMIVFLFCRARIEAGKCTGCAACEIRCPAEALLSENGKSVRHLIYERYRCICCGTCAATCPEEAAELGHAAGWQVFSSSVRRQVIGSFELQVCDMCKAPFGPEPQIAKVGRTVQAENLRLCPRCKTVRTAGVLFQMRF